MLASNEHCAKQRLLIKEESKSESKSKSTFIVKKGILNESSVPLPVESHFDHIYGKASCLRSSCSKCCRSARLHAVGYMMALRGQSYSYPSVAVMIIDLKR